MVQTLKNYRSSKEVKINEYWNSQVTKFTEVGLKGCVALGTGRE